jgi:hypothetical protein
MGHAGNLALGSCISISGNQKKGETPLSEIISKMVKSVKFRWSERSMDLSDKKWDETL